MLGNSCCILHGLFPVTKMNALLQRLVYSRTSWILLSVQPAHVCHTYTFWRLMNFCESAIMSGMVPRTGRFPSPSLRTNSFTARSITQKGTVWQTWKHKDQDLSSYSVRSDVYVFIFAEEPGRYLWCDDVTLLTIEEVFNHTRNLQEREASVDLTLKGETLRNVALDSK